MNDFSRIIKGAAISSSALFSLVSIAKAQEAATNITLPTLYVKSQETANTQPVATYETPISNLEFDPRIDLQSRNMAEAQGDVTIRGGIIENTGFRVGAATLLDPQTGHYFAELPIAPEMIEGPSVYTGVDNALYGFNSNVGTIGYGWTRIHDSGKIIIGAGNNNLNFQRLYGAVTGTIDKFEDWSWGFEGDYSRSESDGTVEFGDHDFNRASVRGQIRGPNSQTDFFAGYQEKFFGLPGMYTGEQFLAFDPFETENLKTRLYVFNHKQSYADNSLIETTVYHRRHTDHYNFNRFSPDRRFIHETKVTSAALSGYHGFQEAFGINYTTQLTEDEIDSTNLEEGDFQDRRYIKFTILPQYTFKLSQTEEILLRAGASFDDTNRNSSKWSPMTDLTWKKTDAKGNTVETYISYSQATQVAGYTAIGGSETSGLFLSNAELDRETSDNVEWGVKLSQGDWSLDAAIFYRWDDNLTDWTYSSSSTSARAASNVDIETFGIELIGSRRWGDLEAIASYTYLNKNEDYGDDTIDASFYALNYAKHRITLGAIWSPCKSVQFRIDNEWRDQVENELRTSGDSAFFTHIGASYFPQKIENLEIFIAVDNAWDDDYQEIPGTPGRGDQYATGITWRW